MRLPSDEPVVYDARLAQWFVFAYDDVRAGLVDQRLTADRMYAFADRAPPGVAEAIRRHAPWIISPEGADYGWIRPLVQAGLRSTTGVEAARAVAGAADELLDALLRRPAFDAVRDYARELTGWMLADFLGVDRRDGQRLAGWGLDLAAFFNDCEITAAGAERMALSAAESVAFAHELLTDRRADLRGGYLELVAQTAAREGRALDGEGVGQLTTPFVAGQVGVAHLVANTIWLLLGHGEQRARLARDPKLLGGAVAESMRHTSPVALVPRIALEPLTLGGRLVGAGETVQLSVAAANRDPARFPDPDRFDITRPQGGALGFGYGAHSCIGAGLARKQAEIAVGALLRRAPRLKLGGGDATWSTVPGLQALESLAVRA